jgi:hypothetical protein
MVAIIVPLCAVEPAPLDREGIGVTKATARPAAPSAVLWMRVQAIIAAERAPADQPVALAPKHRPGATYNLVDAMR